MQIVGLFLIVIGLAMAVFDIIYYKTKNLNVSWIGFGVLYAVGIFGVLSNDSLKEALQISTEKSFFNVWSLVILAIGIISSYFYFQILSNKGDKKLIIGILSAVAIHFILFFSLHAYLLAALLLLNCFISYRREQISIYSTVAMDAGIKMIVGLLLFISPLLK
ncbi:DUF6609 family protein [Enterococcus sp. AZ109]|uniref:DUF6609 family protein n=1 Tax=Enterococcus sp. AZ109 TaxID=2774634 RepID=UPI003F274E73